MRLPTIAIAVTVWLFCAAQAFAQSNQPVVPLLPQQFGGWHLSGQERTSKDAMAADPVNAAVLQEYGFSDFASGTYTNDDGHKLRLKAARFADASGAYGAFTILIRSMQQCCRNTVSAISPRGLIPMTMATSSG